MQPRRIKMKLNRIAIATCFLFLAFSAEGIAKEPEKNQEQIEQIDFSKTGIVIAATDHSNAAMQLQDILNYYHFPSSTGVLSLFLSPHEYVVFKKDEVVTYFCGEEADRKCRAKFNPLIPMFTSMGGRIDVGSKTKEYDAKLFVFDKFRVSKTLNKPTLSSIDGINVKISYKKGRYYIVNN
jgi:hypothetical protein